MPAIRSFRGVRPGRAAIPWQGAFVGALTVLVALVSPDLRAQTAAGEHFLLNAGFPTGASLRPAIAAVGDGFVAVWSSDIASGAGWSSIEGRRFRADGSFIAEQFQVDSYLGSGHDLPDVAAVPGGGFIVVWTSFGSGQSDTSSSSIQARRFAGDGAPIGAQFQVNSFTTDQQLASRVAVTSTGGFVAVWNSLASDDDTSERSIRGRRFDAGDNPVGADFQVNTYTTGNQLYPSVASTGTDEFVVVWHSAGSTGGDTSYHSVQLQRFAADGSRIGGELQVNTYTPYFQSYTSVASTRDGGFIVVWQSEGSTGDDQSSTSIQARRFRSDGTPHSQEFQVNSFTTAVEELPDIHVFPDDTFVVAWFNGYTYGGTVSARQFFADATPVAGQIEVHRPQDFGPRSRLRIGGSAGEFVVAWDDYDFPPPTDVAARGFKSALLIFADGFESGDTSAWTEP